MHLLNLPVSLPGSPCKRGLHIAPWMGENGEIVLLAMTSRKTLAVPPLEIPWGSDSVAMAEELEAILDRVDPPALRII
jgi:hypothetical protein